MSSELWGDVVLSLLFWGVANETTSLQDAPLMYPLFGIGGALSCWRVRTSRAAVARTYWAGRGGRWKPRSVGESM